MSATGLASFDSTVQTTNIWLNEIMERMGWTDRHRAMHALRAVLHALRDRLTVEEAADLGAQLPLLVRGLYYEGWHPSGKPVKDRTKEQFLAHVAEAYRNDPDVDVEEVTRNIFQVLAKHVTSGEIRDIQQMLPVGVRDLWSVTSKAGW